MRLRWTLPLAAALVLALAGCGGGSDTPADAAVAGTTVQLKPMSFSPEVLKVKAGDTVTWEWASKVTHNIMGEGGIDKGNTDRGTYTKTFDRPGTYAYRCTLHPGMDGSIVVE